MSASITRAPVGSQACARTYWHGPSAAFQRRPTQVEICSRGEPYLAEWIARELGGARKVGKQWRCRCPCHDDHDPSLDIVDIDDVVLWTCRAGCDGREIGRELYRR